MLWDLPLCGQVLHGHAGALGKTEAVLSVRFWVELRCWNIQIKQCGGLKVPWESSGAPPLEKSGRASSGFWRLLCGLVGSMWLHYPHCPQELYALLSQHLSSRHWKFTSYPHHSASHLWLVLRIRKAGKEWVPLELLRSRFRAWVFISYFCSHGTFPRAWPQYRFTEDLLNVCYKSGSGPCRVNVTFWGGCLNARHRRNELSRPRAGRRQFLLPLLFGDSMWSETGTNSLAILFTGKEDTFQGQGR